jgi:hypothetical protein
MIGPEPAWRPGWRLWFVAGGPILFIFILRLPFPDHNWDTLNYHLVQMERSLRGWPFLAGDYFPGLTPINPTGDIASGVLRYAFGYRLGTIVNLAVLFWTLSLVHRLLSRYVENLWLRAGACLFIVCTELTLHLLNLYLVDLFAVPFLISAAADTVEHTGDKNAGYRAFRIFLFLGISVAIKLSNLAFALPIGGLFIWRAFIGPSRRSFGKLLVLALLAFALPLLPFTTYIFLQTGSPVFPFFNTIFKSPFVGPFNVHDLEHGPATFLEKLLWPFLVVIFPERGSEMVGGPDAPYTGRIALSFVIGIVGMIIGQKGSPVRSICFLTVLSTILWSFSSGNLRYGIFLEHFGGIVIICTLVTIYRRGREAKHADYRGKKAAIALSLFLLLLLIQMVSSFKQGIAKNQKLFDDDVQPTLFQDPHGYIANTKYILRDRTMDSFVTFPEHEKLQSNCSWINSAETTNGIEVELKPTASIISVGNSYSSVPDFDFLQTAYSRNILKEKLGQKDDLCLYSLSREERLHQSIQYLKRAGLTPVETTVLNVPFFSPYRPLRLILIRVKHDATATDFQ